MGGGIDTLIRKFGIRWGLVSPTPFSQYTERWWGPTVTLALSGVSGRENSVSILLRLRLDSMGFKSR